MRKTRKILVRVCFVLLIWYGINMGRIWWYADEYSEKVSDVALVLGAGTSNGEISPVFRERMNHAIDLWKRQRVQKILITGGIGEGQSVSDSEVARRYATEKGVPNAQIILEETSDITFYNIRNAKWILDSLNLKTALLVSAPYHMLRAHRMCKRVGLEDRPSPTPTSMYRSSGSKIKFLLKEALNFWVFQVYGRFRRVDKPAVTNSVPSA